MQYDDILEPANFEEELDIAQTEDAVQETDNKFHHNEEFWEAIDEELLLKRSQNESPLSAPPKYELNT